MGTILPLEKLRLTSLSQQIARLDHYFQARFRNRFGKVSERLVTYVPAVGGVILDIGANHGKFTRAFARMHGGACRVVAFEPLKYNYTLIERVVAGLPNVHIEKTAVSDAPGTADFYVPVRPSGRISPGSSHLGNERFKDSFGTTTARDVAKTTVPTETIDRVVARLGLSTVHLMKIDVQGAEALVLKGAAHTINTFRPAIYCELVAGCCKYLGGDVVESVRILESAGYTTHELDEKTGRMRPMRFDPSVRDYLFLHPGNPLHGIARDGS